MAAQVGLQVGHEQSGGDAFPRHVSDHESETLLPEIEERVYSKLGRAQDSAPCGPSPLPRRLRVEAMEQGMAVWHVGPLLGVPRIV